MLTKVGAQTARVATAQTTGKQGRAHGSEGRRLDCTPTGSCTRSRKRAAMFFGWVFFFERCNVPALPAPPLRPNTHIEMGETAQIAFASSVSRTGVAGSSRVLA